MTDWNWKQAALTWILDGLLFLVVRYVYTSVAKRRRLAQLHTFGVSWRRLLLYGALMVFGVDRFIGMIAGMMGGSLPLDSHTPTVISTLSFYVLLICGIPLLFAVGTWMSRRSMGLPLALGLAIAFAAPIIGASAGILLAATAYGLALFLSLDLGAYQPLMQNTLASWQDTLLWSTVFLAVPVLAGFLNGTRGVSGAYLSHLLRQVPESTADAIVSLAYEEASKHADHGTHRSALQG